MRVRVRVRVRVGVRVGGGVGVRGGVGGGEGVKVGVRGEGEGAGPGEGWGWGVGAELRPPRAHVVNHVGLLLAHGVVVHAQRAVLVLERRVLQLHLHRPARDLRHHVEDELEVVQRVGVAIEVALNSPMSSCRSMSSWRHMVFISLVMAATHALACSWMSRSSEPTEMAMKSTCGRWEAGKGGGTAD